MVVVVVVNKLSRLAIVCKKSNIVTFYFSFGLSSLYFVGEAAVVALKFLVWYKLEYVGFS